jgi:ATP-binding cassette subfamily B protein
MSDNTKTTQNQKNPMAGARPGGNPMGMMHGGEKARDFKGTIKNLLKYISPFTKQIILVLVFAIASTVFTIVSPKILGNITNQIVNDYTNMVVYDQVMANLPKGMTLPAGTTGEDIIKKIPADMLAKIPQDKLDKIKNVDFSSRPTIQFNIECCIQLFAGMDYVWNFSGNYIQI